ncbi:MAG: molybdenum cofactor guanylyltransferase [Magnetococcales bacterium]|nr:molybdenum cofactor guanylyltransferase [Magnetococcales bacterium]
MDVTNSELSGALLAGGLSRRMSGREKAFLDLAGVPLLLRTLAPLHRISAWSIIANGDAARFSSFGLKVFSDLRPDFPGPLAGIETALTIATTPWVLVIPVDLPFLPEDLVDKLAAAAMDPTQPVTVASRGRLHPTVCLWPRASRPNITAALDANRLALGGWFARNPHQVVEFPCREGAPDPFFNINTPDDLLAARRWLENGITRS